MVRATLSLVLVLLHAACHATHATRVRQELRQLSEAQRLDLFKVLWTLKNTSLEDGKAAFGEDFWPYDYFIIKHAMSVWDPRASHGTDEGHNGPHFMTFHKAIMWEFEVAMLAVLKTWDSMLTAMPYWDQTLDSDTGVYFKDPEQWIFSSKWFGGYTGNASHDYVVTDGAAAWWPIGRFNASLVPEKYRENVTKIAVQSKWPVGAHADGLLRSRYNTLYTPYVVRLPKVNWFLSDPDSDHSEDIVYSTRDAAICTDPSFIKNWMEWQDCIENNRVRQQKNDVATPHNQRTGLNWLHAQFHEKIGSYIPQTTEGWTPHGPISDITMGDFFDIATSPNDVLFPFHHANIDRLNVRWMKLASLAYPNLPAEHWGFPSSFEWFSEAKRTWSPNLAYHWIWAPVEGTRLHDVISSLFPFTRLEGRENPDGFTHADLLEMLAPGAEGQPYTYDTLEPTTVAWGTTEKGTGTSLQRASSGWEFTNLAWLLLFLGFPISCIIGFVSRSTCMKQEDRGDDVSCDSEASETGQTL